MTSFKTLSGQTFSSLQNPNYKRYLTGQSTSLIGTWMQTIAQSWLVLQLTHSATLVGLAARPDWASPRRRTNARCGGDFGLSGFVRQSSKPDIRSTAWFGRFQTGRFRDGHRENTKPA